MINVTFYNFSKRKNSTALPGSGTTSAVVPVLLKDRCAQEAPVLEIESSDPDNYNSYNYVYIPFFNRYYFVDNKYVDTGKRLIFELSEDYLGSASADIKNINNAFIEYSSLVTNNVIDNRIPQTVVPTYTRTDAALSNTVFTHNNGVVILGLTGMYNNGLYVLQNSADLKDLFTDIDLTPFTVSQGSDTNATLYNLADGLLDYAEQFYNKTSSLPCLRSAIQLPWVIHGDAIGDYTSDLKIGSYPTGVGAYRIKVPIIDDHVTITIPWINSNWKRCSKYTDLILYMPLFGLIPLPVDELIDDTEISVYYAFSYSNGDISYQIMGTTSHHIVATGTTNVASPIAMGSSNINIGKEAGNIVSRIGAVGKALSAPMNIAESFTGISTPLSALSDALISSQQSSPLLSGSFGGFSSAALDKVFHLYQFSHNLTESPTNMGSIFGYPRFNVGNLSGLTGFCKLRDYIFGGNFTLSENNKISAMLNGGFYLE